jgi:asparagine synthase (glutamine-hydrolysing)
VSGIFGVLHRTGEPASPAELFRMGQLLAHRGPDGTDQWLDGPAGFGGCILRTTPESRSERIPLVRPGGGLVLAADARLDNRDDLIAELGLADRARDGLTDAEILLAAWERWGPDCPLRLLGDFAFAVWDASRQTLFCARDPMGVRPFCYHESPKGFAFASEIAALLSLPWVPREIDEVRVADHFVPLFEDPEITFYRGLRRLPPASRLWVTPDGIRLDRYWSLDPGKEIRLRSDDEYAEAFRHLFLEAVRCRLRAGGPVSALLSGGLDSSAIVCSARHVLHETGRDVRTFSAIFPSLSEADPRIDERRYIDAVVAMGGIDPRFVEADRFGPLLDLLWQGEEPIPAPNLYMDLALMRAVQDSGSRIVLSGWDGDTTVSHGLEFLGELARTGRWLRLHREARALSDRLAVRTATTRNIMWEFGFRQMIPESARRLWRRARNRPVHDIMGPIRPDFARRIGLERRIRTLSDAGPIPLRSARTVHALNLRSGLLVYALELLDNVTADCTIEARYPFCDRRLIEFCVGLPAGQKLGNGWSRAVMRRAMAPLFPQEVGQRVHKGNLSANFKRRFLEDERSRLDGLMAALPELPGDYLDVEALRDGYRRYASDPLRNEREALTVFLGVTFALWWRERMARMSLPGA